MVMGANEVSQHILCHHEEGLWLGKSTECACQYYTVSTHIYVCENKVAKAPSNYTLHCLQLNSVRNL